jgi:hypothetical protein
VDFDLALSDCWEDFFRDFLDSDPEGLFFLEAPELGLAPSEAEVEEDKELC